MATWTNSVEKSTGSTFKLASDVANSRSSDRSAQGLNVTGKGYSVVGMNAERIPTAITAIEDYVSNIKKTIEQINDKASAKSAFHGSGVEEAVQGYIDSVKKYAGDLTEQLLVFIDKLREVQIAWDKAVQNQAQTIRNSNYNSNYSFRSSFSDGYGNDSASSSNTSNL